jgi:hypothetical protein
MTVTTDSGDAEEVLLRPEVCESENGGAYECVVFMLSMHEDHHVAEIANRVEEIDADLRFVAQTGWFASGIIFDGNLDYALRVAQRWPGVLAAERSQLVPLADLPRAQSRALIGYWRVVLSEPVVGDGIIQAKAGDEINVIYQPESGPGLSASFVMCENLTTGEILDGGLGDIPACE